MSVSRLLGNIRHVLISEMYNQKMCILEVTYTHSLSLSASLSLSLSAV